MFEFRSVKLMKKLSFYIVLASILISCSATKRVPDNKYLLTKNIVFIDSVKTNASELENYFLQKPNDKLLGIPVSLLLYNIGNPEKPKTPSEWGKKNIRSYKTIKAIFSEKQAIAYARSFINLNQWFLKNGQPPTIIDDLKIKKTTHNLRAYYMTQGYFRAKVNSKKTLFKRKKKGIVTYFINKGRPIFIDTIHTKIDSEILSNIYQQKKHESFLQSGKQYNDQDFRNEAKRLIKLYRNNGIYHFSESYLGFEVDTLQIPDRANVTLEVDVNRIVEKNGRYIEKPFQIQTIKEVNVITDYSYTQKNSQISDSLSYRGINFSAYNKLRYNPKYLSQSLFIKPGVIYSDSIRNMTRHHLKSLKNFKSISIKFDELSDNELAANIYLSPKEKFTLGLKSEVTHSNIRNIGISSKFSITNRNTFRGAELLKLSFLGSYFDSKNGAGWEIGTDASLEIPRFIAPFGLHKLVPKTMNPRTLFSLGTSLQKNIGLDRQTFTVLADYKWKFNSKKTIQLEIFNTQYVKNLNVIRYFDIYSSEYSKLNTVAATYYNDPNYTLDKETEAVSFMNIIANDTSFKTLHPQEYQDNLNIYNRYNIITSDFLIPVISYSFTYNNQENFKDNNFSFFKIHVANSGNIMGLLSKSKNRNNKKTFFKIPLAQYFKVDIEYKKFWDVSSKSVVGIRSFLGAILPYDNSSIPFTKSYFAGGSNDIRAWKAYSLGPGKSNTGLEYNIGSLKFITSAEYRFDLFSKLKGALFVDAGNIWDLSKSSFVDSTAKFNGLSSLEDIAVGSGVGFRFDFSFLVFRLDIGFKTYEPYLSGNKWFRNYNLANAVYNIGINYPF